MHAVAAPLTEKPLSRARGLLSWTGYSPAEILVFIAAWTIIGVVFGVQWWLTGGTREAPHSFTHTLAISIVDWYLCGIASIPIAILVRRYPLQPGSIATQLGIYAGTIIIMAVARAALYVPVENAIFARGATFGGELAAGLIPEILTLTMVTFALLSIEYYGAARRRELEAAHLESELTQARLSALELQLQPHFLFNTLNSIAALMHIDVDRAEEMLTRLSEMLRATLVKSNASRVKLSEELIVTQRYLDIMRVRFEERLTVKFDISPEVESESVPRFILQPLVENAVRHGMGGSAAHTTIEIGARTDDGFFSLWVEDDGRGLQSRPIVEGIGITNTRRRLEQMYGGEATLQIQNGRECGFRVDLRIPQGTP